MSLYICYILTPQSLSKLCGLLSFQHKSVLEFQVNRLGGEV